MCWARLIDWCSHCPWVWNCGTFLGFYWLAGTHDSLVGLNNHRQFIIFVSALVVGILLFDYLTWACECLLSSSHVFYSPMFFCQTSHRLRTTLLRQPPASSPRLCAALQLPTCSSFLLPPGRLSSSSGQSCYSLHSSSKSHVK